MSEAKQSSQQHKLTREEKLQFLQTEICILQSRFDKFDNMFMQSRRFAVGLLTLGVGAGITTGSYAIMIVVSFGIVAIACLEIYYRAGFFNRVAQRHNRVRWALNHDHGIEKICIYDPLDAKGDKTHPEHKNYPILTGDTMIFYGGLIAATVLIILMLYLGVIDFKIVDSGES